MASEEAPLRPPRLHWAKEVRGRDCPIPAVPGVYVWYFTSPPALVPVAGCHEWDGSVLLWESDYGVSVVATGGGAAASKGLARIQ